MRELLRDVNVDGYRLRTWDTGRCDHLGKAILAYQFDGPDGVTLFAGEDFGCSPCHAIDSDRSLCSLMGFLTLQPGDTDREYFDDYTPEQMAFAQGPAEYLSLWVSDTEGEEPRFRDWEEGAGL